MFGNSPKETVPGIKIMGFKENQRGGRKGAADLTLAKHGYVRISKSLGDKIGIAGDDHIIFAQFGSTLLIAKRPANQFGHLAVSQKNTKGEAGSSWYGHNKEIATEIGISNYNIADEEVVDDVDNNIVWVKLALISK